MMVKNKTFTIVALLTIAFGIGVNTAVFTVTNSVLFRPLPYSDPDRLVVASGTNAMGQMDNTSDGDFVDWREQNRSFDYLSAWSTWTGNLTGEGEPQRVVVAYVTANFFQLFGVDPILGRAFAPEEENWNGERLAVLSHNIWQRQFGSSPVVLGKRITISSNVFTVVGVMPQYFESADKQIEIWVNPSINLNDELSRDYRANLVLGRLKPGVPIQVAQDEMSALVNRIGSIYPSASAGRGIKLIPLLNYTVGDVRQMLLLFLGSVGFVLLIACADVANLLLALGKTRQKEMAIRLAMGAGRRHVIRQLLVENLVLGLLGGGLGLLLSYLSINIFERLKPGDFPRGGEVNMDMNVLVFTLAISIVSTLAFGLAPAILTTKVDLVSVLKQQYNSDARGVWYHRTHTLLMISEVALALVLLTGANLLIMSFIRSQRLDLGFNSANVLTLQVTLSRTRYGPEQGASFSQRTIQQFESLPGVVSASLASSLPTNEPDLKAPIEVEGAPADSTASRPIVSVRIVGPNYCRAMGIPVIKGREFKESDSLGTMRVTLVSETTANRFWPNEDPLGKRISIDDGGKHWVTVVGVVGDVRNTVFGSGASLDAYVPDRQYNTPTPIFVVRTSRDPSSMITALKAHIATQDAEMPVSNIRTMEQVLGNLMAQRRLSMFIMGIFAAVALFLAVVGIYGVISYSVAQRTKEIGIRMTLGAQRMNILMLIMKRGFVLAILGVSIGLGLGLVISRLLRSFIYSVMETDALTFGLSAAIFAAVVLFANFVPAWRATRVEPMVAIRQD